MRVVVAISILCFIILGMLGMVGYSYYRIAQLETIVSEQQRANTAQLSSALAHISQLDKIVGEQQQKINAQREEIDMLGGMSYGKLNDRLSNLEIAVQPLLTGQPIMLCKHGVFSDVSCDQVTFREK